MKNAIKYTGITLLLIIMSVIGILAEFGVIDSRVAKAEELKSTATSWRTARSEADENASSLDLTAAGDFSEVDSEWFRVPSISELTQANGIQFIACGGNAANDTFSFRILSASAFNGPIEVVCTGTAILGTQPVVRYPMQQGGTYTATLKFWVDTFAITDQWWSDMDTKNNNAANLIDGIIFDAVGTTWFKIEVTSADGSTGIEAGDVTWFWKYF